MYYSMYRDTPIGGLRAFANSNSTAARDMLDPPTPLLPEKTLLPKKPRPSAAKGVLKCIAAGIAMLQPQNNSLYMITSLNGQVTMYI